MNREHLKLARELFQLVGASASECDTIPGRQCMASCFFLLRNFEDVNVYLNSIRAYLSHDDDFNWNHGLALAAAGDYKAAEDALLSIQSDRYKAEYAYLAWLSRCCVMNGNPHYAWELYLQVSQSVSHGWRIGLDWIGRLEGFGWTDFGSGPRTTANPCLSFCLSDRVPPTPPTNTTAPIVRRQTEAATGGSPAAFALLQLLANDCYRMGHFLYAAKAFAVLERLLEPADPEHWEGKRGACAGVFQLVRPCLGKIEMRMRVLVCVHVCECPSHS